MIVSQLRRVSCVHVRCRSLHRVAIVGSGPSGFYSAKYLLEQNKELCVDMYEKLPTPYGLVRFGVAPDHPEVKTVETTFCEVASSPRFRYFGNVSVGHHSSPSGVSVFDVMRSYSGVILAHGATSDNDLDIPGENLEGVHSARRFVNWYNGHPEVPRSADRSFDLSDVEHVVVVGQGNVALDCARIITRDPTELSETDIMLQALDVLRNSNVKRVTVLGRRGHVQSAFTIKEFRELTKLAGVAVHVTASDIQAGLTASTVAELENNRPKKRIVELIQSVAASSTLAPGSGTSGKVIDFRFLLTPQKVVGDDAGRVTGLWVGRNRLEGEPHKQRPVSLDEPPEMIPCQLVLKSVGYRCESLSPDLPFDAKRHVVPHKNGRVLADSRSAAAGGLETVLAPGNGGADALPTVRGLYVAGWLKRGPSGIIGSNIVDAKETVASVLSDLKSGSCGHGLGGDSDPAERLLAHMSGRVVDWQQYLRLDAEESRRGAQSDPPRPRVKIVDRDEMLRVAGGN